MKLGYTKAAKLAQELEDTLQRIYSTTSTREWAAATEREIEKKYSEDPDFIIYYVGYCIACEKTREVSNRCSDCAFAIETGDCGEDRSLFSRVCIAFLKENEK